MYTVYILKSAVDDKFYIGQTSDINDRLRRHNSGYELSTKNGVPWQIIHSEEFTTRAESIRRELQIKSYKGGAAFKKLLNL